MHAVNQKKDATWRRISLTVASGACESCINPDDVPEYPVIETVESKRGDCFYSATEEEIPNLGDVRLPMVMQEGTLKGMALKGTPVAKPLAAVKRICKAGHTCIFDEEGSYIYNKTTGEINWMRDDEEGYMLDVWIPPVEQGFTRQP